MVHFSNLLLFCATKRCFYRESKDLLSILTESLLRIQTYNFDISGKLFY